MNLINLFYALIAMAGFASVVGLIASAIIFVAFAATGDKKESVK